MSSDANAIADEQPWRRLSPEQARSIRFARSPLARRGLDEEEVYGFTHRLAQELGERDAEITKLFDENRRLKQAMREWHSQHRENREQGREGGDAAAVQERVNADAATLMARAQQHIDAQVAQAELYCRQREEEAIQRYDEIVQEARHQAKLDAERVAHQYRASAGGGYSSDREQVQRQQVYLTALLHALDALANHVHATRQAFAVEVQKLGGQAGQTGQTGQPSQGGGRTAQTASQPERASQAQPGSRLGGAGSQTAGQAPSS